MVKRFFLEIINIIISYVLPTIPTFIAVFKFVKESIKETRKPLFFVYRVILKSVSPDSSYYGLQGRLVSKDVVRFTSMSFVLPSFAEWEGDPKYSPCEYGEKVSDTDGKSLEIKQQSDSGKNVILKNKCNENEKEILQIGKNLSYDINAIIVTKNDSEGKIIEKNDIGGEVVIGKDSGKKIKRNKIYTDLDVSLKSEDKKEINNIKVIKCPNIKNLWLWFYLVFSMIIVFSGLTLIRISISSNMSFVMDSKWYLIILKFCYFFLLPLLFTGYFGWVNYKCISQLIILIRMNKFDVPMKSGNVSDDLLIPKITEYMTGTEKVDSV